MPVLRRDRAHTARDHLTFPETKLSIGHPMLALISIPELVVIGLVVPIAVACFAFWVWMLLDCVRNPRLTDTERLIWAIVICLAHLLGAVIYYFAGRRHSKPQNPSATR